MEKKISRTKCVDCKFYLSYNGINAQKMKGILLRPGERYCTGAKKIRLFKPHDPKVYLPDWCPRHKKPSELKIYCYKDSHTTMLRELFRMKDFPTLPYGDEYAPRYQGKSPISAYEFQKRLKEEHLWKILNERVYSYEVIEIDDGIVPFFFFVMGENVECMYSFNREKALHNVLEQSKNV